MNCKDCDYFHINYEPMKVGKSIYDLGRASCKKYNLVTDFSNNRKINRLKCVDEGENN